MLGAYNIGKDLLEKEKQIRNCNIACVQFQVNFFFNKMGYFFPTGKKSVYKGD